jgi:hypothetical protein
MVKNTSVGSKTKSYARKLHFTPTPALRLPDNEYEFVACVTRLLGNGRVMLSTSLPEFPSIQAVIRNKFRGRSKRNHLIQVGSFVLAGLLHWEAPAFKHADILHVFAHDDLSSLSSLPHFNLIQVPSTFASDTNHDIEFSHLSISSTNDIDISASYHDIDLQLI